jgi:hypothetical protein
MVCLLVHSAMCNKVLLESQTVPKTELGVVSHTVIQVNMSRQEVSHIERNGIKQCIQALALNG